MEDRFGGKQILDALCDYEDVLAKPGMGIVRLDLTGIHAKMPKRSADKEARAEELLKRYLQPSAHLWKAVQTALSKGVSFYRMYARLLEVKAKQQRLLKK